MNRAIRQLVQKHAQQQRTHKDLPLAACDLKFLTSKAEDPVRFEGYASVWGRKDWYGDTVLKGAFADSLKERQPMMFFGHSPGRVIGKWIDVQEDDKGLRVLGELTPGHSDAMDVAASLKHGALSGLSIGGYTTASEDTSEGGRLIRAFDLYEISVVSTPAEDAARIDTASVKHLLAECSTIRDVERLLRDVAGLSSAAATGMVAKMRDIVRGDLEQASRGEGDTFRGIASELAKLRIPKI